MPADVIRKPGDGAGLLIQIPDAFLRNVAGDAGFRLPDVHEYGTGLVFLPPDSLQRRQCEDCFATVVAEEGQRLLGWRDVPVNSQAVGRVARAVEPVIRQVFIARGPSARDDDGFERKLFVIRKRMERWVSQSRLAQASYFYVPSLSHRTLNYKGLLLAPQIPGLFPRFAGSRAGFRHCPGSPAV